MKQSELNAFKRKYLDSTKRINQGIIVHDPGTTESHRRLVVEVCEWAHKNGFTFITRAFLKEGKIVDIIIPELPRPFVEIRDSEKKKVKEYLTKFEQDIVFVDVDDPYKLT